MNFYLKLEYPAWGKRLDEVSNNLLKALLKETDKSGTVTVYSP